MISPTQRTTAASNQTKDMKDTKIDNTQNKHTNGKLSDAATCSADFLSKKTVYASFENEERNILIKHHREKRDAYTNLAELIKERTNNSKQIARFRTLSSRHNRRAVSLQNVKHTSRQPEQ